MKDLIVSAADSYIEKIVEALFPRLFISAQTRNFNFDIIKNPGHDPGSYNDSHELLRAFTKQFQFALVIFDYEGSGIETTKSRAEAEADVEHLLSISGWHNRCSVIVIDPEIENWIWQNNPHVETAIGWEQSESLYSWAMKEGKIAKGDAKPFRPKESFHDALRINHTSKSASIYKKIASTVSYKNCSDPAFLKMISKLREWFPV